MMRDKVVTAINKRLEDFRNIKSLKSLYKIESDTNKGYDGRQLLEMFQNCEDEKATTVEIYFDTAKRILRVSNNGPRAFSLAGYDSLLYPGLSSKVSSEYIGNKGLGFRSIINWAEEIRIISNDFILEFKESNKKAVLLEDLKFSEEELNEIREERGYRREIYPMPLLNCGKTLDLTEKHNYTTTVEVKYKEGFEQDIIKQIEGITEETLIFLNNINTVILSGNLFNNKIEVERNNTSDYKLIKSGLNSYYVIEDSGLIAPEFTSQNESVHPKKYSVKIAFSDNLNFSGKYLFNYFKTQIPFEFPFIAHASLELDQNRNHATSALENTFVFKKLVELHLKLVEIIKAKYNRSWLPYRAIATEMYDVYPFYSDLLNENWEKMAVYPTFSGNYLIKDQAKYISNQIADFIESNNINIKTVDHIVIRCDDDLKALEYIDSFDNIKSLLESIAVGLDIRRRADLIKLILVEFQDIKLDILIDEESKIIKSDDAAFTDKTAANKDLIVPSYSNIRFINSELYRLLVDELNIRLLGDDVSRNLAQVLSKISDIQSFEPQTVIKKIISETNHILKQSADQYSTIKEFYRVLFFNYSLRENNPRLENTAIIHALNQNLEIVDIESLAFSENYITGKKVLNILGKIIGPENTIADLEHFGQFPDQEKFEEFLSWLGLNDCFIFETVNSGISEDYLQSLKRHTEWKAVTSYRLLNISNFTSILKGENINKLILWFSQDRELLSIFNNFTAYANNEEELSYGKNKKTQGNFPNFIHYQIQNTLNIKNYLLTSKRSEWFNPFTIDYDYLLQNNSNLDRKEVDRILKFFGAKDSFVELEIAYLENKLQELAARKNHTGAQLFYKNLVAHYKVNGARLNNPLLYAKRGEDIIVDEAKKIYFSDRILLPSNLTNIFPLLYYPSRAGGAAAVQLFGLNDLNTLDFQMERDPVTHYIQPDFEDFLKEIIPFILSFRIEKITNQEARNEQVRKLNSLRILCCTEIECSIAGNTFAVEDLNYIVSEDTYYFKVPAHISIDTLRKNKIFADNLSDLFLKLFDIHDEKMLFETIIRQSKEDNQYDIENNLGDGVYEEALSLLGQISTRLSIWKAIFKLKSCDIAHDLNEHNLDEYIAKNFSDFTDLERFYSADTIDDLQIILNIFKALEIDLETFNHGSQVNISFSKLFKKQLKDFYNSKKKVLKNSIWHNLSLEDRVAQMQFLLLLKKVESLLDFENETFTDLNPNLNSILTKIISEQFTAFAPSLDFDLEVDYNNVQRNNEQFFSEEQLRWLKQDIHWESLKYFDNNIDFLKDAIDSAINSADVQSSESAVFTIDRNMESELVEDYELEESGTDFHRKAAAGPWLASGSGELSGEAKKRLGNEVEEIVYDYLMKQKNVTNLDHVSKTDEGLHYDINYFCLVANEMKYVECKYYNGRSFTLTSDEKDFGYEHKNQYEIWLVDKNSKIYPIKNIADLDIGKPKDYVINFKVKSKKYTSV